MWLVKCMLKDQLTLLTNWAHVTDCNDLEVFISPDIEHGGIDELLVQMIEKKRC